MSLPSSHQSFVMNALNSPQNPKTKNRGIPVRHHNTNISCTHNSHHSNNSTNPTRKNELAKIAMIALAAGVLTTVDPAAAAKSGGRMGGQAFRSSAPSAAPRASSPRVNNSRTNIYINPRVAPPLIGGGYGYGYGVPYGGWGWSPFSFFAPGPSVAVGVGGGFDTLAFFLFLGAAAAVVRRFFGSREEEDDDF